MLWCHILFLNNVRGNDFKQNTPFTAAKSDLEFPIGGNQISLPEMFWTLDQLIFVDGKRSRNKTTFLPPPYEVCGKVMFLHLSVILFTEGGVCHTPRADTP